MITFFHKGSPFDMNLQLHLPNRALFKVERFRMPSLFPPLTYKLCANSLSEAYFQEIPLNK